MRYKLTLTDHEGIVLDHWSVGTEVPPDYPHSENDPDFFVIPSEVERMGIARVSDKEIGEDITKEVMNHLNQTTIYYQEYPPTALLSLLHSDCDGGNGEFETFVPFHLQKRAEEHDQAFRPCISFLKSGQVLWNQIK